MRDGSLLSTRLSTRLDSSGWMKRTVWSTGMSKRRYSSTAWSETRISVSCACWVTSARPWATCSSWTVLPAQMGEGTARIPNRAAMACLNRSRETNREGAT